MGAGRLRNDDILYKVSVQRPEHADSKNYHYATLSLALHKAKEAKNEGKLVFFGEYHLVAELDV